MNVFIQEYLPNTYYVKHDSHTKICNDFEELVNYLANIYMGHTLPEYADMRLETKIEKLKEGIDDIFENL